MCTGNNKKHRKFRAMTNSEFCDKHEHCSVCPKCNGDTYICYMLMNGISGLAPYKTKDGKYILIEVEE